MVRQKYNSHRILLTAIFIGLNALCLLGVTHGRHVARHTRVDYSHIPAHGAGRGSRGERTGLVVSVDRLIDHAFIDHVAKTHLVKSAVAGPSTVSYVASVSTIPRLPRPADRVELLLPRENVLALGSAPRAPDLGRAPPSAA
jgi:hypothetical protein